jgi:hypothetical protein
MSACLAREPERDSADDLSLQGKSLPPDASPEKELALEIMIQSGHPEAVELYAQRAGLCDSHTSLYVRQARLQTIYPFATDREGDIDLSRIHEALSHPALAEAFAAAAHGCVVADLIDGLTAQYTSPEAYDLLGLECVEKAVRNNLRIPEISRKTTELISRAFGHVFSRDTEPRDVERFGKVLGQWADLVDMKKVVDEAIRRFSYPSLDLPATRGRDFLEAVFKEMSALTGEKYVADCIRQHHHCSREELIERGLKGDRDGMEMPAGRYDGKTTKALNRYAKLKSVRPKDVQRLGAALGPDGPRAVAEALGRWIEHDGIEQVRGVVSADGSVLYERELARRAVSSALDKLLSSRSYGILNKLLDLPPDLIEGSSSTLAGFVIAARMIREANPGGLRSNSDEVSGPAAGGRTFTPVPLEKLEEKIRAAMERDGGDLKRLTPRVEKDLSKVEFDTENMEDSGGFGNSTDIVGYHTLENGLSFLGVTAGGDWESPVFFIIYCDGKTLRGYIPTEGNPWNTTTKQAYGNDEEADLADMRKRYPEKGFWHIGPNSFDAASDAPDFEPEKILADIKARIVRK